MNNPIVSFTFNPRVNPTFNPNPMINPRVTPMFKFILIFIFSLTHQNVVANEGASQGSGTPNAGATPEANSKHNKGTQAEKEKSREEEWLELLNRSVALKTKIKMSKENIHTLIKEKDHEKDPKKINEITSQLTKDHRSLQTDINEYNTITSNMQFRFPEKMTGVSKRKYERIEVGSLAELEEKLSLDAKIRNTVEKAKKIFPHSGVDTKNSKKSDSNLKNTPTEKITDPVVIEK